MEADVSAVAASDPVFSAMLPVASPCSDMVMADGTLSPHWQGVISYLNSLGKEELERRHQKALQIMHDHGAAYNAVKSDSTQERPWQLDPIPLPIASETSRFLEQGIKQRTRLMAALFTDIYGPQTLLHNHHLPPALLFANPRFLRPCRGLDLPDAMTLHFHATDICRCDDGKWRVISHLTQIPTGAGYALENRIILSRILPRMFHSGNVLRLVPFFKQLTDALMEISGMEKREPHIVMLSGGPSSPTYFEHAFLSRYLGLTLVESSDLTVRNDAVFLKTLGGLHPVDVIFRQIEDVLCDPLVFGSQSLMGVPGLVQAVRSGQVAMANPLGSAVLETPALAPFLPKLCHLLLGEELILPGPTTLWGGSETDHQKMIDTIQNRQRPLIITSAFDLGHPPPIDTRQLTPEEIAKLCKKIENRPYDYVAMEPLTPCTLPVWEKGDVVNRNAVIRCFSSAVCENRPNAEPIPLVLKTINGGAVPTEATPDHGNSVSISRVNEPTKLSVMPGALTQIFDDPKAIFLHADHRQGGSKDTWCHTDESISYQSMLHRFTEPLEIHRGSDLSSRVADNMLWLGRYLERTEGMLRVIRTLLYRLNSETRLDLIPEFPLLLRFIANLEITPAPLLESDEGYQIRNLEKEILDSLFNTQYPGSFKNALANVNRVAASVRDRLSNDSWHILGRMESELNRFSPHRYNRISETQELVNDLLFILSAFSGLSLESMTRGMGWRFMDIGRRLERTSYMLTLLQSLFSEKSVPERHDLEVLLEVADCTITYHTRYRTTFQTAPVVDLLLLDELNPRAVGFQLAALSDHMNHLPRSMPRPFRTREEKMMLDLTTQLRLTDIDDLMECPQTSTEAGRQTHVSQPAASPADPVVTLCSTDSTDTMGAIDTKNATGTLKTIDTTTKTGQTPVFPHLKTLIDHLSSGVQALANQITQHYLSRIETEKQLRNAFEKRSNEQIEPPGMETDEKNAISTSAEVTSKKEWGVP